MSFKKVRPTVVDGSGKSPQYHCNSYFLTVRIHYCQRLAPWAVAASVLSEQLREIRDVEIY